MMEFKTTTSGETILHLETNEMDMLRLRASQHGALAQTQALNQLDRIVRQNPQLGMDFMPCLDLAFPPKEKPAKPKAGVSPKTDATTELELNIRAQIGTYSAIGATSASMQAVATLMMALATVNQTRMQRECLDNVCDGLAGVIEGLAGVINSSNGMMESLAGAIEGFVAALKKFEND